MSKEKSLLLTFDLEEFPSYRFGVESDFKRLAAISLNGLDKLTELLEEKKARATFFVTWEFSRLCGKQLSQLIAAGHEVGLHGLRHRDNYAAMPPAQALSRLKRARQLLEKSLGTRVRGFRAPNMQGPPLEVVEKAGLLYDSSLHPAFVPFYYSNFLKPRKPFRKDGVLVLPVSAVPIARLPFSWIFFRNLGLGYAKACSRLCLLDSEYLNLYFHPWDFWAVSSKDFPGIPGIALRNMGKNCLQMLGSYIDWCKAKGLRQSTAWDYLRGKNIY